jgi:hypothetical protein
VENGIATEWRLRRAERLRHFLLANPDTPDIGRHERVCEREHKRLTRKLKAAKKSAGYTETKARRPHKRTPADILAELAEKRRRSAL